MKIRSSHWDYVGYFHEYYEQKIKIKAIKFVKITSKPGLKI